MLSRGEALMHRLASMGRQASAKGLVLQQLDEQPCRGLGVTVVDEAPVHSVVDDLEHAPHPRGDGGDFAGHGFEQGEAQGFGAREQGEDVRQSDPGLDAIDETREGHAIFEAVAGHEGPQLALAIEPQSRPRTHQQQMGFGIGRRHAAPGFEQGFQALLLGQAAAVGHDPGVLGQPLLAPFARTLLSRDRLERPGIHPVGDVGDDLRANATGDELLADRIAHGDERVAPHDDAVAQYEVGTCQLVLQSAPARQRRRILATHVAACVDAQDTGLAEQLAERHGHGSEYPQVRDEQQIPLFAATPEQPARRHHVPVAGEDARDAVGAEARDVDAIDHLVHRAVRHVARRHHEERTSSGDEAPRDAAGMGGPTVDVRMERLGQQADARGLRGNRRSSTHALRIVCPPSTSRCTPLMNEAAGSTRLSVACATSSGSP